MDNSQISRLLFSLPILLFAVVSHEYAHGYVAYRLGDPTAKYSGRLTLNPLAHIDPIGTIAVPLLLIVFGFPFVFGWAKPVPINYAYFKNPKSGMMWVGLAGSGANFALALAGSLLIKVGLGSILFPLVQTFVIINLVLAIFNLIPIPPLDGSRVLAGVLPLRAAEKYLMLERYGFIILIIFLYMGLLNKIVWPLVYHIARLLEVL